MTDRGGVVAWLAERFAPESAADQVWVRESSGNYALHIRSAVSGVDGLSGLSLFQAWSKDERAAHLLLRRAVNQATSDRALSTGWAGILAVASALAAGGSRYAELRDGIVSLFNCERETIRRIVEQDEDIADCEMYELLRGYAGTYAALRGDSRFPVSEDLLDFFRWLTAATPTRWRSLHGSHPDRRKPASRLGLAHGIAGVLGAISCGPISVNAPLVRSMARQLASHAQETAFGPQWTFAVGIPIQHDLANIRGGWCTYSLGISCVLAAAGSLIGEEDLVSLARASTEGLVRFGTENWKMRDASLCHGTAGNAVLLRYLGEVTDSDTLRETSEALIEETLARFDPTLPFGFDYRIHLTDVSDSTFFNGSAGIGVCLASLGTEARLQWLPTIGIPYAPYEQSVRRKHPVESPIRSSVIGDIGHRMSAGRPQNQSFEGP